jgi:hypothetical protein
VIEGPQDMTALAGATACIPNHAQTDAVLQQMKNNWGVGTMIADLVVSNMPEDFANTTAEQRRVLYDDVDGIAKVRVHCAVVADLPLEPLVSIVR